MRVLFVAPNYYPHIGGVERHVREVSRELEKDGHLVTILVPKHDDSYRDYEREGNVEVIRLRRPRSRIVASLRRRCQILRRLDLFLRADVIHFHDFATMWRYGRFLRPFLKAMGKKIYITFHGWEGDVPPRTKVVARRRRLARLVDGNICVGHFIEKWYGTRADVVTYGGVHRAPSAGSMGDHVVFVGRLAPDTGIDFYLDAWDRIHRDNPGLRLLLCGDGVLREDLERFVRERGIRGVEFLGFVDDPETHVKDARVVFTSGYLGILEAFSWRKPVVAAYDNELKKDYLEMMPGSREMMWVAHDGREVARCFAEALHDEVKRENAFRYSLENSWEKVKEDYYRLWGVPAGGTAPGEGRNR